MATLVLTGYAAQTRTPGFTAGQTDLGAGVNYQNSWLEVFGQHRKVGPNFNPEVGFLERNDCICDYADVNFKPRPKLRGVRGRSHHGDGLQTQHDAWALLWLALRAENDSYRFGDRQMFLDEL